MKKLTILVDLDSILANLDKKWYPAWNEKNGDDLHPRRVTEWATHKFTKTKCTGIYDLLNEPGFFRDLEPIPGGIDAIKALHEDGHRIVIITSAPDDAPTAHHDKVQWVRQHLPFIGKKDFIGTHAKDMFRADVLIDDGPHNIEAFRNANPAGFIATIGYHYNVKAQHLCNFVAKYNYDEPNFEFVWTGILAAVQDFANPIAQLTMKNIDANGSPLED
jgi:5'-nucleotidase